MQHIKIEIYFLKCMIGIKLKSRNSKQVCMSQTGLTRQVDNLELDIEPSMIYYAYCLQSI